LLFALSLFDLVFLFFFPVSDLFLLIMFGFEHDWPPLLYVVLVLILDYPILIWTVYRSLELSLLLFNIY